MAHTEAHVRAVRPRSAAHHRRARPLRRRGPGYLSDDNVADWVRQWIQQQPKLDIVRVCELPTRAHAVDLEWIVSIACAVLGDGCSADNVVSAA